MVLIIVPAEVPSIAWCYYVRTPPTYDSVVVGNKKTRNSYMYAEKIRGKESDNIHVL